MDGAAESVRMRQDFAIWTKNRWQADIAKLGPEKISQLKIWCPTALPRLKAGNSRRMRIGLELCMEILGPDFEIPPLSPFQNMPPLLFPSPAPAPTKPISRGAVIFVGAILVLGVIGMYWRWDHRRRIQKRKAHSH